jgi:hypothetical protein
LKDVKASDKYIEDTMYYERMYTGHRWHRTKGYRTHRDNLRILFQEDGRFPGKYGSKFLQGKYPSYSRNDAPIPSDDWEVFPLGDLLAKKLGNLPYSWDSVSTLWSL